ncbi:PQQ-like beta-propeller repeat protein, partial [Candidatus Gottesmanbacteria bacterium]|nr:PQQ-like beta-propeller repeat protein [Candidatus Gottesmanbacteria bacterium]
MRKILILSLIVLAAVYFILPTFASAQLANSPWPVFHGNPKLTGQSPYDTSKVNGTIKWKFKTEGGIETSPVIGKDGAIYIIDHKCNLYAIDSSGKEKWKFNGGEPVYTKEWNTWSCSQSTPAIAQDGTIYALTMAGNFFAVSPKGKEKWRYPIFTFKNSWSSPAIGKDGTIYVSSEAYPPTETGKSQERPGYIYALNPDGTKKWEFTNNGAGGSSSVAAVADDGTVYLPTGEFEQSIGTFVGKLFAFNPDG